MWLNIMKMFRSGVGGRQKTPARKAEGAQDKNGQGGDLISGNRSDDLWGGAEKFVEEAEDSVGHQVNMEELTGRGPPPAQKQNDGEHHRVEEEFDL